MFLQEILTAELDRFATETGKDALDILEIGTIRGATSNYERGDGWSTVAFARRVQQHGGSITSVDIDTSTAQTVLDDFFLSPYVDLVEEDSLQVIRRMGPARGRTARKVDVVLLDGANDAQRTLDEFLVARKILRSPGLIIVDDVDMSSQEVVKGHLLVPHLDSEGIPYRIVTREGDGFSTGVLVFRV